MEQTVTTKSRPPTELLQHSNIPKATSFSKFKLSGAKRRFEALTIYAENKRLNESVARLKTKEGKFTQMLKRHNEKNKVFSGQLTNWLINTRSIKNTAIKRENSRIDNMLKHVKSEYRGLRVSTGAN